jgi:anti-sigma factor RsiW
MTCDQAIELLPWYLNSTLEAGEREEVRQHVAACERCRQALAETRQAWTVFDQHISSQDLVALAWGQPPSGIDPAAAEEHLSSCADCAAELELARMSRRLEEEDNVAVFPASGKRRQSSAPARTWRAAAVAASLTALVAASGWIYSAQQAGDLARLARAEATRTAPAPVAPPSLSSSTQDQRQRLAQMEARLKELEADQRDSQEKVAAAQSQLAQVQDLREPQINVWNHDLRMDEVVRDGSRPPEQVIPADHTATAILAADTDVATREREIEIRNDQGRVVWSKAGLRQNTDNPDYSISFPAGFLNPGHYTIQLYSREDGKRVPRESYSIRVK